MDELDSSSFFIFLTQLFNFSIDIFLKIGYKNITIERLQTSKQVVGGSKPRRLLIFFIF